MKFFTVANAKLHNKKHHHGIKKMLKEFQWVSPNLHDQKSKEVKVMSFPTLDMNS